MNGSATTGARGFQPLSFRSASEWDNQLRADFNIQSGYRYNIGRGSLVYMGNDGYIHNITEKAAGPGSQGPINVPILGVFWGVEYPTLYNKNQGFIGVNKPSWAANTVTANGDPAPCKIITDPRVIFTAQMNNTATISAAGYKINAFTVYIQADPATGDPVDFADPPGELLNADGTSTIGLNYNGGQPATVSQASVLLYAPDRRTFNNPLGTYCNVLCLINQNPFAAAAPEFTS